MSICECHHHQVDQDSRVSASQPKPPAPAKAAVGSSSYQTPLANESSHHHKIENLKKSSLRRLRCSKWKNHQDSSKTRQPPKCFSRSLEGPKQSFPDCWPSNSRTCWSNFQKQQRSCGAERISNQLLLHTKQRRDRNWAANSP